MAMAPRHLLLPLLLLLLLLISPIPSHADISSGTSDGTEEWGYIDVRPGVHLFWWLYCKENVITSSNLPLIMWLQGGPGGSGVGFGNFKEVGPLTVDLKPRPSTWLNVGHMLFVDFPVGTGFSYVENSTLFVREKNQATKDLLVFLEKFFGSHKSLGEAPFFVIGESYGGRFATELAIALLKRSNADSLDINLKGIALGDSWTSPLDFLYSWPSLLQSFSLIDEAEARSLLRYADSARFEMENGNFTGATMIWSDMEEAVRKIADDVDFYNLLKHHQSAYELSANASGLARLAARHLSVTETTDLAELMNGPIREKLKIIPSNISWSQFSELAFGALSGDFMKDNIKQVDELLAAGVNITIYSGQLDLIACTTGTETWVRKLTWPDLTGFLSAKRSSLYCDNDRETAAFVKRHKNLSFFWIMNAGHRVPSDNPCMGLKMLELIVGNSGSGSRLLSER
ncbi:hypothetical protein KC19_10G056400 [Ceratodon purpureus]|uniref:Carboxypeptidase n=1 Tax=Ceratodon purpureus TaxID=3225 RepID=A0A8T0GH91_CERPU|nr:hypothetical protein KC19_10G056400 [Ceratodon purpureus]